MVHIDQTNNDVINFKMDLNWYSAKLHALFLHDKDMKAYGVLFECGKIFFLPTDLKVYFTFVALFGDCMCFLHLSLSSQDRDSTEMEEDKNSTLVGEGEGTSLSGVVHSEGGSNP